VDSEGATIQTSHGILRVLSVEVEGHPYLVAASLEVPPVPFVRLHSSCVFGESLGAVDCDCGVQLLASVEAICREGGILVYGWEEGRGVGIADKIRAISLEQTCQMDTAAAFRELGHEPEPRSFAGYVRALQHVYDGRRVRLASSNPAKVSALETAGFEVERVALRVELTPQREVYLEKKRAHLGHYNDD
jgi:GTP cyclohydrolase II